MNHITIGKHSAPCLVFAHGWARNHRDFIQIAECLEPLAQSVLLDLPGFGDTPRPDMAWGSTEYASHCAEFIRRAGFTNVIWVGHSFGGRVGMQLAVHDAELLSGLVLVGGAGIPLQPSVFTSLCRRWRQMRFKLARRSAKNESDIDALEKRYGSADYVQSKALGLRDIFVKVIAEDQSADVTRITIPTRIIYGEQDTETPPETGERLKQLIPRSQLIRCPEFGHIDILSRGRHQIALAIKELLNEDRA